MEKIAYHLGEKLLLKKWKLVTAESCTGGLIAKSITDIAGSSQWFDCGFITYSNESKVQILGVLKSTLETYGAVSQQTVEEMAEKALTNSNAQCAIAVSGIAGPGGGTDNKPVGTVCFAWKMDSSPVISTTQYYTGDRNSVRWCAANYALKKLIDLI